MSLRLYAANANVSQWGYVQQFKECGCEIEVGNDDAQPKKTSIGDKVFEHFT